MEMARRLCRRIPGVLGALGVLLLAMALLSFPEEVKDGVRASVLYCLTALIPSLFPFMVLSCLMVQSGAGELLGRPLAFPTRWGFRLPGCCAAPVIMSFLGGYPAGARSAALLLEQGKITREQAGRMMLFCVNPGTAFVVTYLGGGVLGSYRAGWLLFFSVTLSGLLLGLLSGLRGKIPPKKQEARPIKTGGALVRSVSGAAQSMLIMCACIVSFGALSTLLHATGAYQALVRLLDAQSFLTPPETAAALSFLLEVTGGVGDAVRFHAGLPLYAFGLAFGGLCVHLQVFAMFPGEFPVKKWLFFLFRLLHGLLSAICCQLLCGLLPGGTLETAAPIGTVQAFSGTAAGGLSLLLLCAAFLVAVGKEGNKKLHQ